MMLERPDLVKQMIERADEPLADELVGWLVDSEFLGQVLKHPLVFSTFPAMAWQANDQLTAKKQALAEAREEHDWNQYVFLHERPYRSYALAQIAEEMSDEEYWKLVGDIWIDTENLWQWENLSQVMLSKRPGRCHLMNQEDRETLVNLPDELVIYRGYLKGRGRLRGWAWTLDRARARWFAKRFAALGGKPLVAVGCIAKAHVIAYFGCRGEDEIVVNPRRVRVTESENV